MNEYTPVWYNYPRVGARAYDYIQQFIRSHNMRDDSSGGFYKVSTDRFFVIEKPTPHKPM